MSVLVVLVVSALGALAFALAKDKDDNQWTDASEALTLLSSAEGTPCGGFGSRSIEVISEEEVATPYNLTAIRCQRSGIEIFTGVIRLTDEFGDPIADPDSSAIEDGLAVLGDPAGECNPGSGEGVTFYEHNPIAYVQGQNHYVAWIVLYGETADLESGNEGMGSAHDALGGDFIEESC